MFLDGWKRKSIKRNIQKLIDNSAGSSVSSKIHSVGILIDISAFNDAEQIMNIIKELGIDIDVEVLSYKNKKENLPDQDEFFYDDVIGYNGKIKSETVTNFVLKPFDLLLSYYNAENLVLQFVTARSGARFKVGFPLQKYQLNDLTIHVDLENTTAFKTELKKYLKILNRID